MRRKKFEIEQLIENHIKIHSDKYDYSQFIYKTMNTPTTIICKIIITYFNLISQFKLKIELISQNPFKRICILYVYIKLTIL